MGAHANLASFAVPPPRVPAGPPMPDAAVNPPRETSTAPTPQQLVALRSDMLRFARLQLRDADAAEDMVQDAIEAALRAAGSFAGRSSLKTWVFAILRNRIVDHIRKSTRTIPLSSLVDEGDDWQQQLESFFDERGQWDDEARPARWRSPHESLQDRDFWRVFEACLDHLPANTGRVFMMREFLGFEADEICLRVGITSGNCHVILHRARLKLRDCMQRNWGQPGDAAC